MLLIKVCVLLVGLGPSRLLYGSFIYVVFNCLNIPLQLLMCQYDPLKLYDMSIFDYLVRLFITPIPSKLIVLPI